MGHAQATFATVRRLPAFWLGLIARLALLPVPTSAVSSELFEPFLAASLPLGSNPWAAMPTAAFPYGTVLWGLLLLPRLIGQSLFGAAAMQSPILSQALVKSSMLGCDLAMLLLLSWLSPKRERAMALVYWLNPVLIYITYVHGQLDLAASLFAMAALLAVVHDRTLVAALLWAAASLCKTHVLAALPVIVAYFFKHHFVRRAWLRAGTFVGVWLALLGLGLLPHVFAGTAGYVMATSPEAMRLFGLALDMGNGHVLHVGAAVTLLLLGRLCLSVRMSEAGLLMSVGVLFGTLSLVSGAMPGWYLWSLPTLCLFYVHYLSAPKPVFVAFCGIFLAYFGALDYGSYAVPLLVKHSAFTLLQASYGALLLAVWYFACRHEAPMLAQGRPVLLGIAGDSGTGKNRLSEVLLDVFGRRHSALLEGDDYHRWERGDARWAHCTHLDPTANALEALSMHTTAVLGGRHVWQPHYDHSTGTFTAPRRIGTANLAIVQGLHTFYLRDMRAQFDLKIFLAPHELVRLAWKMHRDVGERGHDREAVLASLARRRADADVHISPQRQEADWIIEFCPAEPITRDAVIAGARPNVVVHHILWNDAPVSDLLAALGAEGLDASLRVERDARDRIRLSVHGELPAAHIGRVAEAVLPPLRTVTRAQHPPRWRDGHQGLEQLLLLCLLGKRGLGSAPQAGRRRG